MTEEQTKISEAIETYLGSYLSPDEKSKISAQYSEGIAAKVEELYDNTIGCPVDWSKASVDDGLGVLADVLNSQYPWLSEKARLKIVHAFIMSWK